VPPAYREWKQLFWFTILSFAKTSAGGQVVDLSVMTRALVSRMVAANPLWGAPRIHAGTPLRFDLEAKTDCVGTTMRLGSALRTRALEISKRLELFRVQAS